MAMARSGPESQADERRGDYPAEKGARQAKRRAFGQRTACLRFALDRPQLGEQPSASSSLDFGVETLQFRPAVFDAEFPIDASLLGVRLSRPVPDFAFHLAQLPDTPPPPP